MKKFIYIPVAVGVLTFGGVVLANTANTNTGEAPAENVESGTSNQTNGSTGSANEQFLTFDDVSSKALEIANGTITDIELDQRARTPHYEVDVFHEGYEYDLKFDAVTGEVLEQKRERDDRDDDDFDDNNVSGAAAEADLISSDEAIKAAKAVAEGTVEKVELDREDGIVYYEVEIENGRTDHEIYVNAEDGSILEHETDDDDDDRD